MRMLERVMKIAGAKLSILPRIDTTMVSDYKKARQVDAGRRRKALNGMGWQAEILVKSARLFTYIGSQTIGFVIQHSSKDRT
jgi:hypothetical protein